MRVARPLGLDASKAPLREGCAVGELAPLRVVLLEARPLVRDALGALLELSGQVMLEASEGDPVAAMSAMRSRPPDVLIISPSVSPGVWLEVVRAVRRDFPGVQCVAVAERVDRSTFEEALDAGVGGFLTYDVSGRDLVAALREVAAGRSRLDVRLSPTERARTAPSLRGLSPREIQVFEMVARGYTSKEIAVALTLSPTTVDTYRHRIYGKLAVTSRSELVQIAIATGLLRVDG